MQVIGNKRGPCFGQPERSKAPSCSIRPRRRLGLLRAVCALLRTLDKKRSQSVNAARESACATNEMLTFSFRRATHPRGAGL